VDTNTSLTIGKQNFLAAFDYLSTNSEKWILIGASRADTANNIEGVVKRKCYGFRIYLLTENLKGVQ